MPSTGALVRTGRAHGVFKPGEAGFPKGAYSAHTRRKLWGTTHDVTSWPGAPNKALNRVERRLAGKNARYARQVRAVTQPSPSTASAYIAGGTTAASLGIVMAADQRKTRMRREAAAKRRRERAVTKRATGRDVLRWGAALGGGSAAGAGASYAATRDKRKSAGAVAGGLAAQGLYQGAGYSTTHYIRGRTGQNLKRTDLTGIKAGTQRRGMLRADLADKKGWEARMNTRRKHIAAHTTGGKTDWPKAYRSWPKEMPYAAGSRAIGHTHTGRRGMAVGAGVTALGALGGARAGRRREVGKAVLYERDKSTSLLRAAGTAAGLGLAAWGLPRHKFLGPALARGVKQAGKHESQAALEALRLAEQAANSLRNVTGRGERRLRTIQHLDQAIDRVPRAIRPEVATAAGVLLVGHSRPVRRERYTPVMVGGGY